MWRNTLTLLLNVSICAQVITKQGITASKSWKSEIGRREPTANGGKIVTKTADG